MNNHEKSHAAGRHEVPIQIYEVRTLCLEWLTLNHDQSQKDGHSTAGYSLALLTRDPSKAHALVLHHMEQDAEGNYDLKGVSQSSILMWTPIEGGSPDYGVVIEIRPYELNYVEADSPEHAWEILGFEQ